MTNETPNNAQPQSDANVVQVSMQTERVLHDFVRNAALGLSTAMKDSTLEFEDDIQWERGPDGHFRESKKRLWRLPPTLSDELPLLPEYQTCVECMKSDAVVGPHLDRLVGTRTSSIRLEADNILISLIYAMLDEEGRLAFTDEKFISKWRDWVSFFESDRIAFKMIARFQILLFQRSRFG